MIYDQIQDKYTLVLGLMEVRRKEPIRFHELDAWVKVVQLGQLA